MELNREEDCLDSSQKTKTLVVILTWLGATPDAVDKYKDLYPNESYDTYVYYPTLKDFLWPKSGIKSSVFVLEELEKKCERKRKLIIHSFSIGCYFYALMVRQMNLNPQKYDVVWSSITAQIFDSAVLGSISEMAYGASVMLTRRPLFASLYRNLLLFYFYVAKSHTAAYYDEVMREINYCTPLVPTLVMAAKDDPMMTPEIFNAFHRNLAKSRQVTCRVWQESDHVQHLRFHPIEYKALVDDLLKLSASRENPKNNYIMPRAKL